MDSKLLRMGVEANRLYYAASELPEPLAPCDVEHRKKLLGQAIDLRICEWQGWSQLPEPSGKLGAAQAAQALGVYHTETSEYEKAREWLERALEHCPADSRCQKRYWYFSCMGDSLRSLVREQLARVQQLAH
jgi:predicted ATPase